MASSKVEKQVKTRKKKEIPKDQNENYGLINQFEKIKKQRKSNRKNENRSILLNLNETELNSVFDYLLKMVKDNTIKFWGGQKHSISVLANTSVKFLKNYGLTGSPSEIISEMLFFLPHHPNWEDLEEEIWMHKENVEISEILRDEIGLWEDLTESLTKELFNKGFTTFFKDISKVLLKESDLCEKLIENCGIYWLINRLLVLWTALESKGAKICSVALIQLPSDSDEFKSKMLFQLFLNNTVKEIVELSIKTIPESFQIFNHKFEKEILNKRVSFILHKAD